MATQIIQVVDSWPRWLKVKEAAKYSSIGRKRLIALAQDGIVRGFPDPDSKRGDWIFDRHSIDGYRVRQSDENKKDDLVVLDIMESCGL